MVSLILKDPFQAKPFCDQHPHHPKGLCAPHGQAGINGESPCPGLGEGADLWIEPYVVKLIKGPGKHKSSVCWLLAQVHNLLAIGGEQTASVQLLYCKLMKKPTMKHSILRGPREFSFLSEPLFVLEESRGGSNQPHPAALCSWRR